MARTKKALLPMDALIAQFLREELEESGLSYREIASRTGMSINRIGIILRQEPPPATIGETGQLAGVVGLTASALLARAEAELATGHLRTNEPISLDSRRPNVGGPAEDDIDIPENVIEEWAGRYAAHPNDGGPEDHTP